MQADIITPPITFEPRFVGYIQWPVTDDIVRDCEHDDAFVIKPIIYNGVDDPHP